jgi:hypothetical protein
LYCAIAVVGMASMLGAQTTSAPKPKSEQPGPLTLTGCVQRSDTGVDQFTLFNRKEKTTYRLTGASARRFVGQRVEVVGTETAPKRLQISGGLLPTPNVAAQAGAMDPAQAATARAGGSAPGTGPAPTLDFRVKSIRPTEGGCPE